MHTGASGDIRPISLNGTGYRGEATATDDTHALTRFDEPPFVDGPHMPGRIWIVPDGPPAPGS